MGQSIDDWTSRSLISIRTRNAGQSSAGSRKHQHAAIVSRKRQRNHATATEHPKCLAYGCNAAPVYAHPYCIDHECSKCDNRFKLGIFGRKCIDCITENHCDQCKTPFSPVSDKQLLINCPGTLLCSGCACVACIKSSNAKPYPRFGGTDLCEYHKCSRCDNSASHFSDEGLLCKYCSCSECTMHPKGMHQVAEGINFIISKPSIPGGRFCCDHTCKFSSADNTRCTNCSEQNGLCFRHTCKLCSEIVKSCGGTYCERHGCKEKGCTEPAKDGHNKCGVEHCLYCDNQEGTICSLNNRCERCRCMFNYKFDSAYVTHCSPCVTTLHRSFIVIAKNNTFFFVVQKVLLVPPCCHNTSRAFLIMFNEFI